VLLQQGLGWGASAGGLILMFWGMGTFVMARTAVFPNQPARALVRHGPYRFTRNPMYVGLTLLYVGTALIANLVWPFVLLPVVILVMTTMIIRREEAYLRRAFGAEYDGYCAGVRRWV
jgi:protein-S-isoprenylcysteine O-methyltransferase Ste14